MDSVCTAAARALARGDPLATLKLVALREDAPALSLRGIAMAQLGDLGRAKVLLERASRRFTPREKLARARCRLALAEVALAARDFGAAGEPMLATLATALVDLGDAPNAGHAKLLLARRRLLLGQVDKAELALASFEASGAPAALGAVADLLTAEIALRRVEVGRARTALDRARAGARAAGIPALAVQIERTLADFDAPAARLVRSGEEVPLRLAQVEEVLSSGDLVVDGLRRCVRRRRQSVSMSRRPVLFSLAVELARSSPEGVDRDALATAVFQVRRVNESHRARMRVEIGRLRRTLRGLADVRATPKGFALATRGDHTACVLLPPIDADGAAVLALLADGEAWSTSALALALGRSQRSVQRELSALHQGSRVTAIGRARARRWLAPPVTGITTALLLPGPPIKT